MPITAAEIETSGWVLRLTVSAALGSFASYTLDPGGTPRVNLTSSHPGFVKSGGEAVAGNIARSTIGTKPLRLPVNPASPLVAVIDETDLGGGLIRVRIALSEHIYATDTGLSLAVLAGWRTGESAASGIAVTNSSTAVAPIPIMRWVLLPYGVTAGAFTVALLVTSHHPVGFEPVAGVKFTATDGTNTKTVWTTALSTENSAGDNLRCYVANIDPATATALTAGLLRVDAEVYPWLGVVRTTDPAGTRAMTTLRTDGFSVAAEAPWVIGYDPAGTRYSQQFVFVDPINGTTTAAAGMVATSLAGAKAVAPASRARDINTAVQAGYLANRTLAAANGQASATRSIDGMQIVLAAGTHAVGSTVITFGLNSVEIPVRIVGDPADVNPRANCILPTSANSMSRVSRLRLDAMTLEIGVNSLVPNCTVLIDNVEVRGRAGSEANSTAPFTATAAPGFYNLALARSRWWRTAAQIGASNTRVGLMRGSEHSRQVANFLCAVKNRFMSGTEDTFVGASVVLAYTTWANATLAGQVEDIIVAWNDVRSLRGRFFGFGTLPAAIAGTPNPSIRRNVVIGNVVERIGADPQPFYSIGEETSATMSYNIIEGNTFVGDRTNTFYSDPLPTTIADTNTQLNQAFINRVAGNAFDWLPTKHDDFSDPETQTVRGTANGYRPQMVAAWSMLYGVGHEGNVDTRREGGGDFQLQYSGARSTAGYSAPIEPLYTDDNSILGPDGAGATGGGDYTLQAGSPLLGRVLRGQADVDFAGLARSGLSDAGAFERSSASLSGATMRIESRMVSAALIVTAGGAVLQGAAARMVSRMAEAALSVTTMPVVLQGSVARMVSRMAAAAISVAGGGNYQPSAARTRGNGESIGFQVKAAGSELDYPIAWTLEATESITSSLWLVSPVEPGGMIVTPDSDKIVGNVTACLVAGGVYRHVYELTNIITTSDLRTYSQTMTFRIGPVEQR